MAIPGLKTPEEIAAEIWGIPVAKLKIKTRKREVVEARMVLMVYRNKTLKLSQAKSAAKYDMDHCSTIHACKTVDELLETNKDFREKHEKFIREIVISYI